MDPNQLLTLFTVGQLGLGAAVVYTILTGQWELLTWVVVAGALFTTLFGYWYVGANN